MVNDTSTLNGALQELGETMADNLVSMGVVDATASDGLTTLANRILDIEPSIGGLDLDTAVSISSSDSRITLGSSIVLTSKLTASYDDKTLVDVDLTGVLQNATVKYFNGSTLIGSGVTDINGIATATITPSAIGTLSLKAVFEGTDNFKNCESSSITVTVVAPSYDGVEITSDKSILSYYDSDSAVLTAQLLDGSSSASVSGVNIGIYQDNVLVDTVTTGNDGSATYTYNSQGIGDTVFEAKVGSLSSETYTIEDCTYYNSAEVTRVTTNGSTIYDSDMAVALPTNCEITLEAWSNNSATDSGEHRFFMLPKSQYSSGTTQPQYALFVDLLGQNNAKFGKRQSNSSMNVGSTFSATRSTYHTVKLVKTGTSIAFYFNDDLKATESESWIDNYSDYTFSMMRWGTGGTSKLRNVKIKAL